LGNSNLANLKDFVKECIKYWFLVPQ
jgi:hypothetical protein